jgi:hypothetical protein
LRESALNDWLQQRALKNESRFSRAYVVCDGNQVVAYICISAGSVERAAAPGKLRRNAPDTIQVSVMGRLAVSRAYAGRVSAQTSWRTRYAGSRSPRRASAWGRC